MSARSEGQASRTDTQPPQLQEQAHHRLLMSTYSIWDRMADEPHAFAAISLCKSAFSDHLLPNPSLDGCSLTSETKPVSCLSHVVRESRFGIFLMFFFLTFSR